MTLNQFYEKIIRRLSLGIATDENRWDRDYIISKANDARAVVARADFIQTRRWHPQLIQRVRPKYEQLYQTNVCVTRFKLPTPLIQADQLGDGFISCGSDILDEDSNPYAFKQLRRMKTRMELHDLMMHPVSSKVMFPAILIENTNVEIYSKNVIYKPVLYGVFYEPQNVRGFRPDVDEYLITGEMTQAAEDFIYKQFIQMTLTPDTLSNSKEDVPNRR